VIVVADTSPLNYLILIDQADLLPSLFGEVLLPVQFTGSFSTRRLPKECGSGLRRRLNG